MRTALWLFAAGLVLRIAFVLATPDRAWAWAAAYQGDAPTWQDLAQKAAAGAPDLLLALPLRPPGMPWLASLLWNGADGTALGMRLLFAALGALVAPLLFLALRREFAPRVAALAAGTCAVATNLVLLSSGLHVETPYLVLLSLILFDWREVRNGARPHVALRWGALHGLATLLRAEHPLALLLFLLLLWRQRGARRLRTALLALAACGAVLLPWQLHAMAAVARFNTAGAPPLPRPGALAWDPDALAAVRALPAFQQWPTFGFVDATVRVRGGRRVTVADLRVVDEAYGCHGEPLATPWLTLYGPINFFLANSPENAGAFGIAPLFRPPPLAGGSARYPPGLVLPTSLTPDYPPHLHALNHGYALGLAAIAEQPGRALGWAADKATYFWQGAASGVGGYGLPMGLSGERRRVDLVTADSPLATVWRLLVLATFVAGLWRSRRDPALYGWLVPFATSLAACLLFFGYARLGALALPSVALGTALALDRWLERWPESRLRRVGLAVLGGIVLLELVRCLTAPVPTVDGRPVGPRDPWPALEYEVRAVRY